MSRLRKAGDVRPDVRQDGTLERHAREVAAARAEGLAQGLLQGRAEGRAHAEDTASAATVRGAAALEALLARTSAQAVAEIAQTGSAVLTAALEVAQWVLRAEVTAGGRSLLNRLEAALEELLPSPETRVHVCPGDAVVVRGWAAGHSGVTVVVDPSLAPGDALVRTRSGEVDVTIAAALRVAADVLSVQAPPAVTIGLAA